MSLYKIIGAKMLSNEDKLIQTGEIENYVGIGKTKIKEIIESGNFVKPIFISGFAYALYSVREIQQWIEDQKQKRNAKK